MPLSNSVLIKYRNPVFVETGLENGKGIFIAEEVGFTDIHSFEANPHYVNLVKDMPRFQAMTNVTVHSGDSGKLLADVIKNIDDPITFWLDAHPFADPMSLSQCPLLQELDAIAHHCLHLPTVLVDDIRVFSQEDKDRIVAAVIAVPGISLITYEPGQVPNDILVGAGAGD